MKNHEEEITRLEETFDELVTRVCEVSPDDRNFWGDEGAYTRAADKVRAIALKAAAKYRKHCQSPPPHVASAMFFMPTEPGTDSGVSNVDLTSDDQAVKSQLDDTQEQVTRSIPRDIDAPLAETSKWKKKAWTLMFFFASDNTLSPSVLPQLKAISAAGSQVDTNVLVYFDPNERSTPATRVFDTNETQTPTAASYGNAATGKLKAGTALEHFLGFCSEAYPAEHYMLFFAGHGLAGRGAFLPDDNPDSAIDLKILGQLLKQFKNRIGDDALELIGTDSCSMSSVEVAYELRGTAKYMLASQGPFFVGSWPYRQLLTQIYHNVQQGDVNVDKLARSLHALCVKHSLDVIDAGYSSDLSLCSLDRDRVHALTDPISKLSHVLQSGLEEPRYRDLILLAHWKSQSYWQETYTDLYDFCLCLKRLCRNPLDGQGSFDRDVKRNAIIQACDAVIEALKPENSQGPVVCSDYVGPDLQYSNGLSIYFPWSDSCEDENDRVLNQYEEYAFTQALPVQQTWLRFLDVYFDKTKRPDRISEERADTSSKYLERGYQDFIGNLRQNFPQDNATSSRDFFPMSVLEGKVSPPDSTSGPCSCASMKNYSRLFSMSPGAATLFDNTELKKASGSAGPSDQTGGSSQ